jgi:hypothetical protein
MQKPAKVQTFCGSSQIESTGTGKPFVSDFLPEL